MARLHLAYREDAFDRRLIELTTRFFEVGPWDLGYERKFDTWAHGASIVYGLPFVSVEIGDGKPTTLTRWRRPVGVYTPLEDGWGHIWLPRPSAIGLFHQYRHHMSANALPEGEVWNHDRDGQDAQEWGCSLFYVCKPRLFRKAVRDGRIAGVHPEDLLKKRRKAS